NTNENVIIIFGAICQRAIDAQFFLHDPEAPEKTNSFKINTVGEVPVEGGGCRTLVASTGRQTIFNRRALGENLASDFAMFPCGRTNHLIFVNSQLGQYYFPSDLEHVGVFAMEPEPIWRSGSMAGLGRHVL